MMPQQLTLALPKGRLLTQSLPLLRRVGCDVGAIGDGTRRLIVEDATGRWRFILAKPNDVPVYVEHGVADLGIVGQDILREQGSDVYEPLSLGFGRCRMVLAGPASRSVANVRLESVLRIATKYPAITRAYFQEQGLAIEVIPLSGSVEVAPAAGLADLLVDIVDTGRTLRENGLVEIETLFTSEAVLIANRASYKLYGSGFLQILHCFEQALTEGVEG